MGANGSNGSNGSSPPEPGDGPSLEAWVPGPGWQRRASPVRRRRRWARRRLRLVLAASGGVLLLVAWSLAFTSGVRSVEPTVDDEDFLAEAEDLCTSVRDRLAEAAAEREEELTPAEQAAALRATVDALAAMVRDLRDIQPPGADGEEVAAWLADWERVLDTGRRIAEALRRDDREAAAAADRAGQGPARAVNAFAGANGLPACGTARAS